MALNFLNVGSNSNSAIKYFDIRLDSNYIVFRGSDHEAPGASIQGTLVLCLSEPLTTKHIHLSLCGISRVSYHLASSNAITGRRLAYKEVMFYEKNWNFRDAGKNKTETLQPGNYEFPFDLILEGSMPESVEGVDHSWIMYRFKAEIGRKYQKDIIIRKPLRIVRTLDSGALELSHAMSVENTWVDKIDYTISTPTKAIVYGSALQVDFRLVPLLKGLVMGHVTTQIKEEQEYTLDPAYGLASATTAYKFDRIIAHDEYTVDADADAEVLDEEAEGYQFTRYLELPKSLNDCLQDCSVKGIKIRHKIKFNVQLHNPDGHVSELRANLPVSFYISPGLPIGDDNALIDQTPHAIRQAVDSDIATSAPPVYGQHQLDQLFSDISISGYQTPSGISTSGTPHSLSRNISSEHLNGHGQVHSTSHSPSSSPNGQYLSPAALQSRLHNLRGNTPPTHSPLSQGQIPLNQPETSPDSTHNGENDYFSQSSSSGRSPSIPHDIASVPASRRVSEEDETTSSSSPPTGLSGTHTPRPQFYHAEELLRVPSYQTAVRTPAPRLSISNRGLPSYSTTISVAGPSQPMSAHLRGRGGSPPTSRPIAFIASEERRLRVMQHAGR